MNTPAEKKNDALMVSAGGAAGFLDPGDESELLSPPRIKLLQRMSKEVESVDGAKPGMFYNETTGELSESIEFIPVGTTKSYLEFEQGKVVSRASNDTDARNIWGSEYWRHRNCPIFMCIDGGSLPLMFNFHGTAMNAYKSWYKAAKFTGRDMWASKYTLTSQKKDSDKGEYFEVKVSLPSQVEADEYQVARSVAEQLSGVINKVEPVAAQVQSTNDAEPEGIPF